jgi:hypothetical protein
MTNNQPDNKFENEIKDYNKVIELSPNDYKAYSNHGATYFDLVRVVDN